MIKTNSLVNRNKLPLTEKQSIFKEEIKAYAKDHVKKIVTQSEIDFLCRVRARAGHFFILTELQFHALVMTLGRQCSRSENDDLETLRFYTKEQAIVYELEESNLIAFNYAKTSDNFPYNRLDVGKGFFDDCIKLDTQLRQLDKNTRPNFIMFSITSKALLYIRPNSGSGRSFPCSFALCSMELRQPDLDTYGLPEQFGKCEDSKSLQRLIVNTWSLGIWIDFSWPEADFEMEDRKELIDFRDEYGATFICH